MNWKKFQIHPKGTHHLCEGNPLYSERFDQVLYFRKPGLAAVQKGERGWHIDPQGRSVYTRRFLRTFNFYEGLAAVISQDGWHHILPSGEDLHPGRYDWAGNFCSGRATVRSKEGRYFHIDHRGEKAYSPSWKYAGDYVHSIAVAQSNHGLSTHIDLEGNPIHGQWYLDLDVYHKGYARAKDRSGWMHIDSSGNPVYGRRFAMVETFYNGQARVERLDGALEIIDETGRIMHLLRPPQRDDFGELSSQIVGYWTSVGIWTAVELGIIDCLPATTKELAESRSLVPEYLDRFMCALGSLNIVEKKQEQWFATKNQENQK